MHGEMSDRAIAEHVGVDGKTVARHRQKEVGCGTPHLETASEEPKTRKGRDGKQYPAKKEEPEKDGPPEIPKDPFGIYLPDSVAADFAESRQLSELVNALTQVKSRVTKLSEDGSRIVSRLILSGWTVDLRNVRYALRSCTPYCVCRYCGGEGCKACRKTGWQTKTEYDNVPSELKAEVVKP